MFIELAYAQSAGGTDGGDIFSLLLPFVLIFVVMYFLIIRPQQKRIKTQKEMVNNLRRGDVIVTSGGLLGKIHRVIDEAELIVEIAEGVRVVQVRQMITEVRSRTEPLSQSRIDSHQTDSPEKTRKSNKAKKHTHDNKTHDNKAKDNKKQQKQQKQQN